MPGDILKRVPEPRGSGPPSGPRLREPRFEVFWESRRQNLGASLRAVLGGPKPTKEPPRGPYFRDSWVQSSWPKRAVLASALWHLVLVFVPFPHWSSRRPQAEPQRTFVATELTYYPPARDLPQVNPRGTPSRPSPPGEPEKPLPQRGAQAFHPRQTIISAPKVPTHPRQTLIAPEAPPEPPKILPPMPNIVQWAESMEPARPKLQISRAVLARLRPKRRAMRPVADLPVPEFPNPESRPSDLNLIASASSAVQQPRMPVPAMSVPSPGPRQVAGEAVAPDIRPNVKGEAGVGRLIAIPPTPAAPATNLPAPSGNLAANTTISPEGTQPGVPGGSPGGTPGSTGGSGGGPGSPGGNSSGGGTRPGSGTAGNGSGPPGVSISGGHPNSAVSVTGHAEPSEDAPTPPALVAAKPDSHPAPEDSGRMSPAPGFDRIQPGAPPESIFGPKRVYTLHVNMPNLASVTGSWVLSFVEMNRTDDQARTASADLTGPVPLRKVDPKYPASMRNAKVEGEVVLYAIIRRDGSVDSIQLVRGIEPELDSNAMDALSRWRFRPAERQGTPVELETIVHIPFRSVVPN